MTFRADIRQLVEESTNPLLQVAPTWGRVRLGDVADVINGFAFPSSGFNRTKGMPLLRIRDIEAGQTQTCFDGPFEDAYRVPHGALVVGMDGDFNLAVWSGPEALLNQRVCRVIVRDRSVYSEQFLRWVLPAYLSEINRHTPSVTVKHLSSETVKNIPLPFPELSEQHRIVAVIEEHFSSLETGADVVQGAFEKLGQFRKSALQSLCSDRGGRRWPEVPLDRLLISARYGTSTKCDVNGAGVPVLRIPNVVDGRISLEGLKRARDSHLDLSASMVAENDILIIRTNGSRSLIGRAAKVGLLPTAMAFASYLIQLRVDSQAIRPDFLVAALEAPRLRNRIEAMAATTAGQYNISLSKLRTLLVPLAPISEQQEGLDRVQHWTESRDRTSSELARLQARVDRLRVAILAAAFTGKLVRPGPSWKTPPTVAGGVAGGSGSSNGKKPGLSRRQKVTR